MVNAVNASRDIPELGARGQGASVPSELSVQDVRNEAVRVIDRHKRRHGEFALPCPGPLPPRAAVVGLAHGVFGPAQASISDDAGDPSGAMRGQPDSFSRVCSGPALPSPAGGLEVANAGQDRDAGPSPMTGQFLVPGSYLPQQFPSHEQGSMEPRMPFDGADEARAESFTQDVALPLPRNASDLTSREMRQAASATHDTPTAAGRGHHAASAPTRTLDVATGQRETTVFEVPLRGLGPQQSTQVSLNAASGQVVLTPSSERAAEILGGAAQYTDWVRMEEGCDDRRHGRQDPDPDDEDGQ